MTYNELYLTYTYDKIRAIEVGIIGYLTEYHR